MSTKWDQVDWNSDTIIHLLTRERLHSYLEASCGDQDQALVLYDWNIRAAGAVLGFVGMAEVVVRNAIDRELQRQAERKGWSDWLDEAPLDDRGAKDVERARKRVGRRSLQHPRGKIIAELSLGFWRYLCASRYHTSLWVPSLNNAFPLGASDLRRRRQEVERALRDLSFVRNRAAHHEPLHHRNLTDDVATAANLVGWVSPEARSWLVSGESVEKVSSERPTLKGANGPGDSRHM